MDLTFRLCVLKSMRIRRRKHGTDEECSRAGYCSLMGQFEYDMWCDVETHVDHTSRRCFIQRTPAIRSSQFALGIFRWMDAHEWDMNRKFIKLSNKKYIQNSQFMRQRACFFTVTTMTTDDQPHHRYLDAQRLVSDGFHGFVISNSVYFLSRCCVASDEWVSV